MEGAQISGEASVTAPFWFGNPRVLRGGGTRETGHGLEECTPIPHPHHPRETGPRSARGPVGVRFRGPPQSRALTLTVYRGGGYLSLGHRQVRLRAWEKGDSALI